MDVNLFDFELPPERIALRPAEPRDAARLLVLEGDAGFRDAAVRDLPRLLRAGDCLVFNDTRVIPAQLEGTRGDARIGATLHKRLDLRRWQAFVRNAKRLRPGDRIDFGAGVFAIAEARDEEGGFSLAFEGEEPVEVLLERAGRMPLPPYIAGKRAADERDRADYQTMFAEKDGAVAAPTAALHFTPELVMALAETGIATERVTLHVGAGTFLPVKAENTVDHKMHAEWGSIMRGCRGAAQCGTRTGRAVRSRSGQPRYAFWRAPRTTKAVIHPWTGETRIFITPGYRFRAIDGLMTNFHLPRSTLFMLVSALMGLERMQAAYSHAIAHGYRFYSYGDASLLLP
jgi:S-adenosylmethionine:tRNA ribosyltransferase-isomerase